MILEPTPFSSLFKAWLLGDVYKNQAQTLVLLEKIMTTVTELSTVLTELGTQLAKAKNEIVAKIAALEDALENTTLPPEAEAALEALKTAGQTLDDIVPDAPVE